MSAATATTIIAIVGIMAALVAWVVWLSARNNGQVRHLHSYVDVLHAYGHEYSLVSHDHDGSYADMDHDHNDQYSPIDHAHDRDYAPLAHSHHEYVTHDGMNNRFAQIERQVAVLRTMIIQSPIGILLGVLFGGLIGALVGFILDLTLPRSVFEVHATTTFNVNGQKIVQQLTSYDAWPKWGIPLGCAVAGMILGGLALWALGMYRNRQQSAN